MVVILKKQLALEVSPRGKIISLKRNQLANLRRQKTGVSPRKRGNSKEEPLNSGPEEAAESKSSISKKK